MALWSTRDAVLCTKQLYTTAPQLCLLYNIPCCCHGEHTPPLCPLISDGSVSSTPPADAPPTPVSTDPGQEVSGSQGKPERRHSKRGPPPTPPTPYAGAGPGAGVVSMAARTTEHDGPKAQASLWGHTVLLLCVCFVSQRSTTFRLRGLLW